MWQAVVTSFLFKGWILFFFTNPTVTNLATLENILQHHFYPALFQVFFILFVRFKSSPFFLDMICSAQNLMLHVDTKTQLVVDRTVVDHMWIAWWAASLDVKAACTTPYFTSFSPIDVYSWSFASSLSMKPVMIRCRYTKLLFLDFKKLRNCFWFFIRVYSVLWKDVERILDEETFIVKWSG